MHSGEFLENFFTEQGSFEPNAQGEAAVLCPFPHEKGIETRPSAHVNVKKALFHCKTCFAEGRFDNGGLSEIGFVAEIFEISYDQAIKFMSTLQKSNTPDDEIWMRQQEALWANAGYMEYLTEQRGLTLQTIKDYRLGFPGDGITYPVTVYGELCDIRTYDPGATPKMRSQKGASPLLFPFDAWRSDVRTTVLCAGENDALLARQLGFNALTATAGEGQFPKVFLNLFKDRDVFICYDCDDAGRKGARRVAFQLWEAGARVRLVDLQLPGTKDDKDITDFIVKDGKGRADFLERLDLAIVYDGELVAEDKNANYPLVDLWNVPEGRFHGKRISSRVVLSGKYDAAMHTPTAIEWKCNGARLDDEGKSPCWSCRLNDTAAEKSGWWTLDDNNLKDMMKFVDVTEDQQRKAINQALGRPDKCPNGSYAIKARQVVYKVVLTPDVESETALDGFRAVEQYAYTIGLNLEDGARYRAFFRPYAHPLDGQRVFMVVDRVEDSDNAINTFRITPEVVESLKVFQGDPAVMMKARAEMAKAIVGPFAPESVVYAVDLMYHSPLRFKDPRGKEIKGYPEGLVIGDTRTGKSDTAVGLQKYYGIGNFTAVKRATTAGLLGGAEKLPSGGFKVSWGTVPRNNKGLVFLDEMSDCALDVIASLTDMRSSGIATVHKIAKGKAPANTRLLWISNPRKGTDGRNMSVSDYPTGVSIVMDLIGSTEDIARFDFVMLIPEGAIISPHEAVPLQAHDPVLYKNLIYWVWSRTADQILWEEGVEKYVWQVSQELNEKYNTDIKFFGAEAWKKLARIAVACAGACFSSSDDGESIVVTKAHVDWASDFLRRCYDNSVFQLAEYVRDKRVYSETNDAVNTVVAGMCRNYPTVIRTLLSMTSAIPRPNLEAVSGLDRNDFNGLVSDLMGSYLMTIDAQGFRATRRLKKAVQAYREDYASSKMIPLSEMGGLPV